MQPSIRWAGLVVLLGFVLPVCGADEKTDKKKPADDKKSEVKKSDYVVFGRAFVATVVSVENGSVKVVVKYPVRNGKNVEVKEQEREFELAEDARIRTETLRPKVDDEGKVVKRTPEEIKELKGKDWGYAGTVEHVKEGRVVRVFLGKKRGAEKDDPPLITQLQIARMPGDDKAEGGASSGGENADLVPFGQPFVAMFNRMENSTIHLIRRSSVLVNGKVEYRDSNMTIEAADEVKIRIELPPPALDDNGRVKKYTKEDLKELKGDDEKAWGYPGTWDNLEAGRIVKVFLAKTKGAPRTDPPVIIGLNVAKEPGDTKIDPAELAFIERVPTKKDEEKKDDKKDKKDAKDDKKDAKEDKKDEDRPPLYGRPFLATVTRIENNRVGLNIKERYLEGTTVKWRDKNVDFNLYEAARIRTQDPPLAFDDKGGLKKYSAEELKELKKGTEEIWGFPADTESLQPGRKVKVFLGKYLEDKKDPPVILQIFVARAPKGAE